MTKKQMDNWFAKMLTKYSKILLLQTAEIGFKLDNSIAGIAECSFRYPYNDFTIKYTDYFVNCMDTDKVRAEKILVHELCHIITDPLYSKALSRHVDKGSIEDTREELTDLIQLIVTNLTIKSK